jgi:hypothetical protein
MRDVEPGANADLEYPSSSRAAHANALVA